MSLREWERALSARHDAMLRDYAQRMTAPGVVAEVRNRRLVVEVDGERFGTARTHSGCRRILRKLRYAGRAPWSVTNLDGGAS